jgi:hypothetical protein
MLRWTVLGVNNEMEVGFCKRNVRLNVSVEILKKNIEGSVRTAFFQVKTRYYLTG